MKIIKVPNGVYSDQTGYEWLISVASRLKPLYADVVCFDFSDTTFFDGNLCSVLGAILYEAKNSFNRIEFGVLDMPKFTRRALSMNQFLKHYGGASSPDDYDTSITYNRFNRGETKTFLNYLELELINKDLPLTNESRRSFRSALAEVFENANRHSGSKLGVFSCGQHFPTKEYINYTLVDLGVGFERTVSDRIGHHVPAPLALKWAVQKGHSGRTDNTPGGLGLSQIADIVAENEGRFQIVSGYGYWEMNTDGSSVALLSQPFPGSIVNLQINTALEKHWQVEEKQREEDEKRQSLDGSIF